QPGSPDRGGGRGSGAVGRVQDEVGAVDVGPDVAQADRDPLDDVGDRVRAGGVDEDFGGLGVDLERVAHDHGAEVEGTGLGGGHGDDAQGGAVEGAGQVDLAGDVDQDLADAGARPGMADLTRRWARGSDQLFFAAVGAGPGLGG